MFRKHRIKTSGRFRESHVGTPKVGVNPPAPPPALQTPGPGFAHPWGAAGHLMEVLSFRRREGPRPESSVEQPSLGAHAEEARDEPRRTA